MRATANVRPYVHIDFSIDAQHFVICRNDLYVVRPQDRGSAHSKASYQVHPSLARRETREN